ncbi:MAG: DNA-binding transcriptional regulator [Phycisphaerales bacterium]|nr:MAG: DNA-binding transcriptional regulator [Phycisphaerales bacterium]
MPGVSKMPDVRKVVLLINPSREHTRGLLNGIAKYARLHSSWMFYRPLEYREPRFRQKLPSVLKALQPDGILMREPPHADEIIKMGVPVVSFPYTRERIPGIANVITDHVAVGHVAAEHLLERGFRCFAYCGFDDWWWSRQRKEGFSEAVAKADFPVHAYQLPRARSKRTWGKELPIIVAWLEALPKPVGLMASNDDRAELVIEACKTAGLSVPDEVAVVGVDNDRTICDLSSPPLSSVALNVGKAGYDAAALLDRMMATGLEAPQTIYIQPTHVVTRLSTDVLAVDDPDVATAVRYIRRHARTSVGVAAVVANSGASRRVLEKRFRQVLGHTIHDEISRVRLELVTAMLTETSMAISEIARELEFPDVAHLSRYFRKATGLSPLQYRKQFVL